MKRGVLLLNMGGPNNIEEVEIFLRNMFADKNILPMNRYLRAFVGKRIVSKRLREAQDNYRQIGGKSPLNQISKQLAKKIEDRVGVPVRSAMRYVPPFADIALKEFQKLDIEEMILFPMYPHFSTTTTLSSIEDIKQRLQQISYNPKITIIEPYYKADQYVALQVDLIVEALGDKVAEDYDLILSAHGLPLSIIQAGDPYQEQVEKNVELIKKELSKRGIIFKNIKLAYQSKVGKSSWLEPNLSDMLRNPENLRVLIFPIAFTIDNSETIFELDIENRDIARKIGYEDYMVAKCPNDSDDFAEFVSAQIEAI